MWVQNPLDTHRGIWRNVLKKCLRRNVFDVFEFCGLSFLVVLSHFCPFSLFFCLTLTLPNPYHLFLCPFTLCLLCLALSLCLFPSFLNHLPTLTLNLVRTITVLCACTWLLHACSLSIVPLRTVLPFLPDPSVVFTTRRKWWRTESPQAMSPLLWDHRLVA